MKESQRFLAEMAKIQNRIKSNDKRPRSFGTSCLLHQSEIHLIDAIEPGEGIMASNLARKMGITNGAVTQLADKLLKKGLLVKQKRPGNRKEVYLTLTKAGETAYHSHLRFHEELSSRMTAYLDSLKPEEMAVLTNFVKIIDQNLPDLEKEREEKEREERA
ncbi:MarR family transcriptional regulator [candidate division KSB3 bacterium]|uniref:MarR family transcriptional regulator n=1 Tax=candidate division KSB3 bacterium TaxID=2044937 RepID=A0A2G6E0V2_9BACT|nr:MAG: MarR family transcriptional regulator [candidate division KSB3 bacterium]